MRMGIVIVLFLLLVIQNIVCMDFVRKALAFEKSGENKRELLDAKFEMMAQDIEEHHKKTKKRYLIYKAIYAIEDGIYAKEQWQSGEIDCLFNSLLSPKYPGATVEENIERFEQY